MFQSGGPVKKTSAAAAHPPKILLALGAAPDYKYSYRAGTYT
jgi:hypothetical protein